MKNIATTFLLLALLGFSCSAISHSLFGKKTPHEQYEGKLSDAGLDNTAKGRQWLEASKKALEAPQIITLPYNQEGYFTADRPRALGLQFKAQMGERLIFTFTRKEAARFRLYADLFKQEGSDPTPLISADTTSSQFSFDVEETGTYVLRLQPELNRTGEYNLSVAVGPSLGFPVAGGKGRIGSFWGADRDGGRRRHEGVDIFAPRLTPVVAAADGIVVGLRNGGIGGKTVWMKATDKKVYLYYAHLHKQLVHEGQVVKKGQILGLVGNTGNARHTASHLHFGVYSAQGRGALDPLPFVDPNIKTAPAPLGKELAGYIKLTKALKIGAGALVKANTTLVPLAVTSNGYIAELPDGTQLQVPSDAVQIVKQAEKSNEALVTMPAEISKKS
jgi:murein DD-endopeptidase MepM/ murein hydrolase activator NlpD